MTKKKSETGETPDVVLSRELLNQDPKKFKIGSHEYRLVVREYNRVWNQNHSEKLVYEDQFANMLRAVRRNFSNKPR